MENVVVIKKQQGVVLIVALIMVVVVAGIAVTLMSSSSIDIKITNAAQEREVAEHELIGTVQKVVAREVSAKGNSRFFYHKTQITDDGFDLGALDGAQNVMKSLNNGPKELNCPRSFGYTDGFVCNLVEINSTINYGSKSKHSLTILSGISQQMLDLNNDN